MTVAREPVTDDTPAVALTMLDVASLLFPEPGKFHLRMVVEGQGSSTENYYWQRRGAWREVGPFPPDKEPSPVDLIAENNWARVRFSPALTFSAVASELARVPRASPSQLARRASSRFRPTRVYSVGETARRIRMQLS